MTLKRIFLILIFAFAYIYAFTQVNITSPAHICSGDTVNLVANSSFGTSPFTYNWSSTPAGVYPQNSTIQVSPSQTTTYTVTVSDNFGLTASASAVIIVYPIPDAALDTINTFPSTHYEPQHHMFINCFASVTNPNFDFIAVNAGTTQSTDSIYILDWGDGYTDTIFGGFTNISHTYSSLGFFTITYTVINPGCTSVISYVFFNGSSPAGNLGILGGANLCAPYTYSWPVQNASFNPPGTEYIFTINDGSPPQIFNQSNLPDSITHTFLSTSCGIPPNNNFAVTFTVKNVCDSTTSVSMIKVSEAPLASFSILPDTVICVDAVTTINNTSIGNFFWNNACISDFNTEWTITPSTGWTSNPQPPSGNDFQLTFTTPGIYDIKMKIYVPGYQYTTNECLIDSLTRTVCVMPAPEPMFNVSDSVICSPDTIYITNLSMTTSMCGLNPAYSWNITSSSTSCATSANFFEFINGTSSTSFEPVIVFHEPGIYDITLTIDSSCASPSYSRIINVAAAPQFNISNIPDFCVGNYITPSLNHNNCNGNSIFTQWLFPGGTPGFSNQMVPGDIYYYNAGNYTITFIDSNYCGMTIGHSNSFEVYPGYFLPDFYDTICSGQSFAILPVHNPPTTIIPPNTTYSWAAPSGTGFAGGTAGTSQNDISGTLFNTTTGIQTAIYTVTPSTGLPGNCGNQAFNVSVTILPAPQIPDTTITICTGDPFVFSPVNNPPATLIPSNTTYSWGAPGVTGGLTGGIAAFGQTEISGLLINPTGFPQTATYSVTPTSGAQGNCQGDHFLLTVIVNPLPLIQDITYNVCSGDSFAYLPTHNPPSTIAPPGTQYTWAAPVVSGGMTGGSAALNQNSMNGILNNPTLTVQTATYTVTPTIPGAGICQGAPFTFTVNVFPLPQVDFSMPDSLCHGAPADFVNLSLLPGSSLQYQWSFQNAIPQSSNLQNPSGIVFSNTSLITDSLYAVSLYVIETTSGLGCADSITQNIIIHPLPFADFTFTDACFGFENSFSDASVNTTGTIYSWLWDFGDGTGSSIADSTTYLYNAPGTYGVTLTVTNSNNCVNTITDTVTVHPLPVAAFSPSDTVLCLNSPIPFTDNSHIPLAVNDSIVSWNWDFDDSFSSNLQHPQHTFSDTGFFHISLLVTTNFGCQDSVTETIEIIDTPLPYFTFFPDSLCSGLPVTTANMTTGLYITDYIWNFSGAATTDTIFWPDTMQATYPPSQYFEDYIISLTAVNQCGSVTYDTLVTVKPLPYFSIGFSSDTICSGDFVLFNDVVTNLHNMDTLTWNFGDGSPEETWTNFPNSVTHYFYYTGTNTCTTYTVTATAVNECGTHTETQEITVCQPPFVINFSSAPSFGCDPLTVTFTNFSQGTDISNIQWDFGDGNTSNSINQIVQHTYMTPGTFTPTITYWSNICGTTVSASGAPVIVYPHTPATFSFSGGNCLYDTISFFPDTAAVPQITSYFWDFGDPGTTGDTSVFTFPQYNYPTHGTFNVSLTAENMYGCISQTIQPVTVTHMPTADFALTPPAGCHPLDVAFINLTDSATTYTWSIGAQTYTGIQPPPSVFNNPSVCNEAEYPITLIAEIQGCADTIVRVVTVYPTPNSVFQSTDTVNCYFGTSADVLFLAEDSCIQTFHWHLNNPTQPVWSSPDSQYLMTINNQGTNDITLIVTNQYQCQDTSSMQITLYPGPEDLLNFAPDQGCQPLAVTFTPGADGLMYHYIFGDGNTASSGSQIIHTYSDTGTYSLQVTVLGQGGCSTTLVYTDTIQVFPVSVAEFILLGINPLNTTYAEFQNTSVNADSYYWDFGDGFSPEYNLSPVVGHTYENNGIYYVTLFADNEFNCPSEHTIAVEIAVAFLKVPNAVFPSGHHPLVSHFHPVGMGLATYSLQIYDSWGNLVWETQQIDEHGRPAIGWDGNNMKGEPLQMDVYTWKIEATFFNGKSWEGMEDERGRFRRAGTVTLLR